MGRDKRPKSQYGSVTLKIRNWMKILAFKANNSFPNKTMKAGERYAFRKESRYRGSCSLETHALPFAQNIQSGRFKKGI